MRDQRIARRECSLGRLRNGTVAESLALKGAPQPTGLQSEIRRFEYNRLKNVPEVFHRAGARLYRSGEKKRRVLYHTVSTQPFRALPTERSRV